MKKTKLIVKTKDKKYNILIGKNLLKNTGLFINKEFKNIKKIGIITDSNVPKVLIKNIKESLKKFDIIVFVLKPGEKTKNFRTIDVLINWILKNNFSRSDCLIAVGGGVVGDITGFTANLIKRGIKFINIPTTLLSQVDASIGGKTAVNSKYGKNLIGTFYQPDLVISDISAIKYLPQRELVCGYAEILKHSLIEDKVFFYWLDKNAKKIIAERNLDSIKYAIIKSCKIKSKVVTKDEKEKNYRMILNFGHTFGHAFEGITNYSKKLNHGEAVLLGILLICDFSHFNKLLSLHDLNVIKKHYTKYNLPTNYNQFLKNKNFYKIISFIKADKKNIEQKLNLVLIKKIGKSFVTKKFSVTKIKAFLKNAI